MKICRDCLQEIPPARVAAMMSNITWTARPTCVDCSKTQPENVTTTAEPATAVRLTAWHMSSNGCTRIYNGNTQASPTTAKRTLSAAEVASVPSAQLTGIKDGGDVAVMLRTGAMRGTYRINATT